MTMHPDRRVPLSRGRVLHTALTLVDGGGIEALSMRKLGQALGVEAMSLYNHVANKDDILDGITDLVLSEIEVSDAGEGWEEALRRWAISAHDALLRHRWVCTLLLSSTRIRPARLRYTESLLRRLREAGFSAQATYHAYHALDSHILGFTIWQLGHAMPAGAPPIRNSADLAPFMRSVLPEFSPADYPYLLEHAEQHFNPANLVSGSEFEFGLQLILNGLRQLRDPAGRP